MKALFNLVNAPLNKGNKRQQPFSLCLLEKKKRN